MVTITFKVGDRIKYSTYTGTIVAITETEIHTQWDTYNHICKDKIDGSVVRQMEPIQTEWDL